MIFVGVDPGKRAGLAFVNEYGCDAVNLPESVHEAAEVVQSEDWSFNGGGEVHAYLELVHSMSKQGVVSSFTFGKSFGRLEALLAVCYGNINYVRPQVWKAHFGLLKKDKRASLELARELFPSVPLPLMKDHNKAEALLIAKYGYDTHGEK